MQRRRCWSSARCPSQPWGHGDPASPTLSPGRPWRSVSNPPAPEDPKHPQRPSWVYGAVSFQEALESRDGSTGTEGSGVSWGAVFSPAGFTPLFGKLRPGTHPDPPWPLFLLSPAPGKPQSSQPRSLPPQRQEERTRWALCTFGITNLSGPPTACKHSSSTVREGDPSLLRPQPHHTHMFTWARAHIHMPIWAHTCTCAHTHTEMCRPDSVPLTAVKGKGRTRHVLTSPVKLMLQVH